MKRKNNNLLLIEWEILSKTIKDKKIPLKDKDPETKFQKDTSKKEDYINSNHPILPLDPILSKDKILDNMNNKIFPETGINNIQTIQDSTTSSQI